MRIRLVSPSLASLEAIENATIQQSNKDLATNLRCLHHHPNRASIEEDWAKTTSNREIEDIAVTTMARKLWQSVARVADADLLLFNFQNLQPAGLFARNTTAVAFIAAFSWPNVHILLNLAGDDAHARMIRFLFDEVPNPPKLIYDLDQLPR